MKMSFETAEYEGSAESKRLQEPGWFEKRPMSPDDRLAVTTALSLPDDAPSEEIEAALQVLFPNAIASLLPETILEYQTLAAHPDVDEEERKRLTIDAWRRGAEITREIKSNKFKGLEGEQLINAVARQLRLDDSMTKASGGVRHWLNASEERRRERLLNEIGLPEEYLDEVMAAINARTVEMAEENGERIFGDPADQGRRLERLEQQKPGAISREEYKAVLGNIFRADSEDDK
jgi:hypothetical protein